MSWELSLVFKATVVLGVTLAAVGLSPKTRASRRHLILASASRRSSCCRWPGRSCRPWPSPFG